MFESALTDAKQRNSRSFCKVMWMYSILYSLSIAAHLFVELSRHVIYVCHLFCTVACSTCTVGTIVCVILTGLRHYFLHALMKGIYFFCKATLGSPCNVFPCAIKGRRRRSRITIMYLYCAVTLLCGLFAGT